MVLQTTRKFPLYRQFLISILIVGLTTLVCFVTVDFIGFRAVALILLLVVSVIAILFDFYPVIVSAIISSLVWNYFFIPPILTFHISTPEDGLMFLMYIVIASISALLTFKIREIEHNERTEEQKAKAISLYNTLLNSLSHELRTPISAIIGAIDTLKENHASQNDNDIFELYLEIEKAGLRLNRQVENLLNMSRLEAGFIQPKNDWCDINEIIYLSIKHNLQDIGDRNILFDANELLPPVYIDGGLTEQIINNLLHNAIHHTPEGSTITIEASGENGNLLLAIADNGLGFEEDEIELAFEKFFRIQKSKSGGTGLGLSIVKGYTEALNGQINLENNAGHGVKFTILIPCEFATNIKM